MQSKKMLPLTDKRALVIYLQQQRKRRKDNEASADNLTPVITSQPSDQSVTAGSTPAFTVAATVPSGSIDYQWQADTGTGFVDLPAQTSATLTLAPVGLINNGNLLRVQVRANSRSAVSRSALLTVTL